MSESKFWQNGREKKSMNKGGGKVLGRAYGKAADTATDQGDDSAFHYQTVSVEIRVDGETTDFHSS